MSLRSRLLELTPDAPPTFEERALLLDEETDVSGDERNAVVRNSHAKLIVLRGSPDPRLIEPALSGTDPAWRILGHEAREDVARDWSWERSMLMTLSDRSFYDRTPTEATPELGPLTDDDINENLVPVNADVLLSARKYGEVFGFWVNRDLAACAYTILRTKLHFHPWVHVFRNYRGRGVAKQLGLYQVAVELRAGFLPVVAPLESDRPAVQGCLRAGFSIVGQRWMAAAPMPY